MAANPTPSGAKLSPASSADNPSPSWRKSVSPSMMLPKYAKTPTLTTRPALNERALNRVRSSTGWPPQEARRESNRGHADREVDEEDRAPTPVEEVGLDEHAAVDLAGDRAQADRHAEPGERTGALRRREERGDQGEHLWHHRGGSESLRHPGNDQLERCLRETAGRGGDREERHPGEKEPAVGEPVAEPPAGDEERGEGEGVAADHQLEIGQRRVDVLLQVRSRDVDDEEVEQTHEGRDQDHRQRRPTPRVSCAHGLRPHHAKGG